MYKIIELFCVFFLVSVVVVNCAKKFEIDYERNVFVKDGQDFRYISGSIHYFRLVPQYWDSILEKMRLGGLNTITTYVDWQSHQPKPEQNFNFEGNLNLFKFLETAQKNDLLVVLRTGPYMDAERDMGGLPNWLLWQKQNISLRSSDLEYVYYVSKWFDHLLPRLKPYLYNNGGPIISLQVENEYGSFSCDKEYPIFLRDLIRSHLGQDLVLFTTDGAGVDYLKCGALPQVYPTVDFGPESMAEINASFSAQRQFAPKGPLVNSEFYPGWLDHWQKPHSKRTAKDVAKSLDGILSLGANVNIYMYYGGTSFGYKAGSNADGNGKNFDPCPTSYDYDAPLDEAGDPTDKYYAIKDVISSYVPVPIKTPPKSFKAKYGTVKLKPFVDIFNKDFQSILVNRPIKSVDPLSFEELKIGSGFVLYETEMNLLVPDPSIISAPQLKDRAYIYVDEELIGVLSRQQNIYQTNIFIKPKQKLSILVENQGRVCYGKSIGESKGLGPVQVGGSDLKNWTHYKLGEMDGKLISKYFETLSKNGEISAGRKSGVFYFGKFKADNGKWPLLDTFVNFDGWTKGVIWINGFNLGRYWPVVGPQMTLYLPGPLLKKSPELNTILIFELEKCPYGCTNMVQFNCSVELTDKHDIDGPTPYKEAPILNLNQKYRQQDQIF